MQSTTKKTLTAKKVLTLSNRRFISLLDSIGACDKSIDWIDKRTAQQAFTECAEPAWMLWLLGEMADKPGWLTRQQIVLLACDFAETALKFVPNGGERPRNAINLARQWANGDTTISVQDLHAAANAAADAAANAAANAAYAAADAAARDKTKKQFCDLIRERILAID